MFATLIVTCLTRVGKPKIGNLKWGPKGVHYALYINVKKALQSLKLLIDYSNTCIIEFMEFEIFYSIARSL